ncbi:MAG: glycosyltransferase [Muribaculaceae bacterium]|nr:glycosyltransferase [Muribaculaceae bacterium]
MKIFYYFLEYDTPMYGWQRQNHIDELIRAGHEVVTFNPAQYGSMTQANSEAVKMLRQGSGWDMFLACDDQDVLFPETVGRVREMGIPSCLICWDNLELPYKQKKIAPLFDVVWLTSAETSYLFERWGCRNILFMPYAANPFIYQPSAAEEPVRAVGFIGSPYGSRTNKINDLTAGGIPCRIYSNALVDPSYNSSLKNGRKSFHPLNLAVKTTRYLRFPIGRRVLWSTILNRFSRSSELDTTTPMLIGEPSVPFSSMCALYSALTLSLNIAELRDTYVLSQPIPKLHLRTFEIPMSGGLQLTSRTPEITNYFDEGREIVLYSSREEMVDKARYYLDPHHDSEVARMKAAARRRAEAEHTWMSRFNRIFATLGVH